MPDREWILERIRRSPKEHLGQVSVSKIGCYMMGYDTARNFWGLPDVHRGLSRDKRREWQESKFHLCRQGLESFCVLVSEDEQQAFELFFEFHDMALADCEADLEFKEDLEAAGFDPTTATKSRTLVAFILHEEVRKRPAMYFGSKKVSLMWATCSGFLWAEKDLGIIDSSDSMNLELFQIWLDERYPMASGQPWDKLFYFQGLSSESTGLELFYENFEMFL